MAIAVDEGYADMLQYLVDVCGVNPHTPLLENRWEEVSAGGTVLRLVLPAIVLSCGVCHAAPHMYLTLCSRGLQELEGIHPPLHWLAESAPETAAWWWSKYPVHVEDGDRDILKITVRVSCGVSML